MEFLLGLLLEFVGEAIFGAVLWVVAVACEQTARVLLFTARVARAIIEAL